MAHADEYHDVEAAKQHLREVHQVGENRINDEHDAKPLFTRDIDLLSFHLQLHDRGTLVQHVLDEHRDEVNPDEVTAAQRKQDWDRFALEWHVRTLHPRRS
ncbi:MAG: hypothetical protein ABSF89_14145 [Acidimicrobiales bacterium]